MPRTLQELSGAIDDFHLSTPMATYHELNSELQELLKHSSSVREKSLLFNLLDTLEAKAEATDKNRRCAQNQDKHSHFQSVEFDANRYFEGLEKTLGPTTPKTDKHAQFTPQQENHNESQSHDFKETLTQSKDHLAQQEKEKTLAEAEKKRADKDKAPSSNEEQHSRDSSKKLK